MPRGGGGGGGLQKSMDALTQALTQVANLLQQGARQGQPLAGGGAGSSGAGSPTNPALAALGIFPGGGAKLSEGNRFAQGALSKVGQVAASFGPAGEAVSVAAGAGQAGLQAFGKAGGMGGGAGAAAAGGIAAAAEIGVAALKDLGQEYSRERSAGRAGYLGAPEGVSDDVAQRYGAFAKRQAMLTDDSWTAALADPFRHLVGQRNSAERLTLAREEKQEFNRTERVDQTARGNVFDRYAELVGYTGKEISAERLQADFEMERRRAKSINDLREKTQALSSRLAGTAPEHRLMGT